MTSTSDIIGGYQACIFSMFTVISIQQHIPSIFKALQVGKEVITVIDRKPLISAPEDLNRSVVEIKIGDGIKFSNVCFRYPTAPESVRDVF